MYLSSLLINLGDNPDRPRPARKWLRNLYRVHQRLCMAFPSQTRKISDPEFIRPYDPAEFPETNVHVARNTEAGFLFRVDPLQGGRAILLVQSATQPDWDYAFHNAGHMLAAPTAVKPWNPSVAVGQNLRFRLKANPTKKVRKLPRNQALPGTEGRHGQRIPVPATPKELRQWLAKREEKGGFQLTGDLMTQPGYVYVNKTGKKDDGHRYRSVLYDGTLEVTDPDAFGQTLIRGIGPAKAFGFGLLSIAPTG